MANGVPRSEGTGRSERARAFLEARGIATAARIVKHRERVHAPRAGLGQERLWFIESLQPRGSTYSIPSAYHVYGSLRADVLEQAFTAIARRHESLRTTFDLRDGVVHQVVHPPKPHIHIPVITLTSPGRSEDLDAIIAAECRRPFSIRSGDLWRVLLVRILDDHHVLFWNFHHSICDAWSIGLLHAEVSRLYQAFLEHGEDPVMDEPLQFADFSDWQREALAGGAFDPALAKWNDLLESAPVMTTIGPDGHRPPDGVSRGSVAPLLIPASLSGAVRTYARSKGIGVSALLLAAHVLLLYQHTRDTDLVIGMPVANRNRPGLETVLGFLVNTVPVRVRVVPEETLEVFLERVADAVVRTLSIADAPVEKIVERLNPARDLSRHPIFQQVFAFQNAPGDPLSLAGTAVESIDIPWTTTKFDASWCVYDTQPELRGYVEYSTDLYSRALVERLTRRYVELLGEIIIDTGRSVAALKLISDEQRAALVQSGKGPLRSYEDATVWDAIVRRRHDTPAAIALDTGNETISYAALIDEASSFAERLSRLGVRRGGRVAVVLENSADLVLAMLAVWALGAVYVPCDPSLPVERLDLMVRRAGVALVICGPRLPHDFPGSAVLPYDRGTFRGRPAELRGPTSAGDIAYVMFTSGSAGSPKAVVVDHGALLNTIEAHVEALHMRSGDRMLLFATPAFDGSLFQILVSLAAGATVVILARDELLVPASLQSHVAEHRITLLNLPPAMLSLVDPARMPRTLHTVIVGGDRCREETALRWSSGRRLLNSYGPTEGAIACTLGTLDGDDVHIGRPVANAEVYLLDDGLEPVLFGTVGEICIGGAGVALGYLDDPAQTAERFVPNPFGSRGSRLFRTGDLGRYRDDGALLFVGRADSQVKIRGCRVELDEVRLRLEEHGRVERAEMRITEDAAGDPAILAYVVTRGLAESKAERVQAEHISDWHAVFDNTLETASPQDDAFHYGGWNKSSGEAFSEAEMREWRDGTLARLLARRPFRRVLELGCGTGLIALPLLEHIREEYVGTDMSAPSLQHVRNVVAHRSQAAPIVRLIEAGANDLPGVQGVFDLIVINSVVQYFPSAEYLLDVLQNALARLTPDGMIFLGDLRHNGLAHAFATWRALASLPGTATTAGLAALIRQRVFEERELLLSPEFFLELRSSGLIGDVRCELKLGHALNELNCFRFDVWLGHPRPPEPATGGANVAYELESLEDVLGGCAATEDASVTISGIPNARVTPHLDAWQVLESGLAPATAGDMLVRGFPPAPHPLDPASALETARRFGYDGSVQLGKGDSARTFDLVLNRRGVRA